MARLEVFSDQRQYFQIGTIDADSSRPPFGFAWKWSDWVRPPTGCDLRLGATTARAGDVPVLRHDGAAVVPTVAGGFRSGCIPPHRVSALPRVHVSVPLDQTDSQNHDDLTCLPALVMAFVAAHHAFSLNTWMRPHRELQTAIEQ